MSYAPQFTITPALLARVETIAAVRERILGAAVQVWLGNQCRLAAVTNASTSATPWAFAEIRKPDAIPRPASPPSAGFTQKSMRS